MILPNISFLVVLLWYSQKVEGWGYRYNYNPGTGESNLWTYLPGQAQPVVYDYYPGQDWPRIYTVNYDGLLPGQSVLPSTPYFDDPSLYRYKGPDGKFRYKCKPEAYYSEYQRKCVWKPGRNRNRDQ